MNITKINVYFYLFAIIFVIFFSLDKFYKRHNYKKKTLYIFISGATNFGPC